MKLFIFYFLIYSLIYFLIYSLIYSPVFNFKKLKKVPLEFFHIIKQIIHYINTWQYSMNRTETIFNQY